MASTRTTKQLPTQRALLTTLFNTLFQIEAPPPSLPSERGLRPEISTPPSNPLKSLSPPQRALLTTLHVIFPPPTLLQALNLLDRQLVSRFTETSSSTPGPPAPREDDGLRTVHCGAQVSNGKNQVYLVRSSQPPKSRFRDLSSGSGMGGGKVYAVHLQAWNCSCAAFAFQAFPSSAQPFAKKAPWDAVSYLRPEQNIGGSRNMERERRGSQDRDEDGDGGNESRWEFGGLCADEDIPVCKHLLACLLGDRWGLLGAYVKEWRAGRDELAGLGCED